MDESINIVKDEFYYKLSSMPRLSNHFMDGEIDDEIEDVHNRHLNKSERQANYAPKKDTKLTESFDVSDLLDI